MVSHTYYWDTRSLPFDFNQNRSSKGPQLVKLISDDLYIHSRNLRALGVYCPLAKNPLQAPQETEKLYEQNNVQHYFKTCDLPMSPLHKFRKQKCKT